MIKYKNVYLDSITHIEPDELISSDWIEHELKETYETLKLPFGRIEMQTGVQTRGIFHNKRPSEIATLAAKKLLKESSIEKEEIGLLIHAGVCRDMLEPSTASFIHHNLDLEDNCISFDLSNACLGVVSAMMIAAKMIESGAIETALIVTGENSKSLLDNTIKTIKEDRPDRKEIKKYFANFTIGSSGVALLLSGESTGALAQLIKSNSLSNTADVELCQGGGDVNNLVMETDSTKLLEQGIKLAQKNMQDFFESEIDHYICHQVGIMHRDFLYKKLDLDISKDHTTFDKYGNTGSAALPLTLSIAHQNNEIKSGEDVLLLGIGSGLHATLMELRWS